MNNNHTSFPAAQDSKTLWQHRSVSRRQICGVQQASVVVSLYNYADCILDTLNRVKDQTYANLELLIVDDASSDAGCDLVLAWIQEHYLRFTSTTLLRHQRNSGLAAARNTGFAHVHNPWVWVQDADNHLAPWALQQAMQIAARVEKRVAVIHPLLLCEPATAARTVFQGGGQPWQRSAFLRANCVDAMALVRHEAWQSVNGYTHIDGGWEDYDFWCKLIENGWHGLQIPQVAGSYFVHESSMTATTALPHARKLEACLQERHPWLDCLGATSRYFTSGGG